LHIAHNQLSEQMNLKQSKRQRLKTFISNAATAKDTQCDALKRRGAQSTQDAQSIKHAQ
jgi:hypothetical protein